MASHKHKKKQESDSSSSESDASTSSSESSNKKKKYSKKTKHSSSEESDEKYSKSKRRRSSDFSDTEETRKHKNRKQDTVESSSDYKNKEKDRSDKLKEGERQKERSRYKSPDKDRAKSRDRDVEESHSRRDYDKDRYEDKDRNRRDYNNKDRQDRQDDRYRNKRDDHRRDDRRSFRDQGDKKEYRDDNNEYKNRGRGRRDNNRYGNRRRSSSFDHANAKWGKQEGAKSEKKEPQQKEKPNFKLTGKLTEETNTYKGIVIKYSEPPEARKPRRRWRLYPFKGEKALQTLYIHRESAYLIGRERKVVDLPVDHPSCSKQHAVLQYRLVPFTRDDGSSGKRVRPYLIDLESANGTLINNKKIEPKKYVELFEKDVIKFGYSSREYVLLHENSKDEAMDDDVKQEEEDLPIKEEPV